MGSLAGFMGLLGGESGRDGNEGPQHRVHFAKPFVLGVTQVTFDDYDYFAHATGRMLPDDKGWGRDKRPVINVNWNNAMEYMAWLSIQTGRPYRLPSEAEWEYAARAGTTTPFSTGNCIRTDQANYNGDWEDYAGCGAKTGEYRRETLPVGSLPPNPWGLQEMHGNVWEWTADCWHGNYQGAPTDGNAWDKESGGNCSRHVVRGGSWYDGPGFLRSASRFWIWHDGASDTLGFRLAMSL